MEKQYKILQSWFKYVLRVLSRKASRFGLNSDTPLTGQDKTNLKSLGKTLTSAYKTITEDMSDLIQDNAHELCEQVVTEVEDETDVKPDNRDELVDAIIAAVITGTIYEVDWTLKRALEREAERLGKLVEAVIQSGIDRNKNPAQIVKDLEEVLNPTRLGQKSYETKDGMITVTKIDGEAQRLARTTVEHIFQEGIIETAEMLEDNTKYRVMIRWVSALEENTCQVCESRHNQLYEPQDLPLEHPNGQCDFYIELYPA